MIFQAMAGQYRPVDTLKHLFTIGTRHCERELKEALSVRYDAPVSDITLYYKGRAALAEATRLMTGGSGKVAVSGLTCYSLVQAVKAAGCEPVFVDIDAAHLQFTADTLAKAYKKHPEIKAIIVQNMLGMPVNMSQIELFAQEHHLKIIEDLAHSAGSHYADGREVGTVGDATMLSFGKGKAIDTVNGGALLIRNSPERAHVPKTKPELSSQLRDRIFPLVASLARLKLSLKIKIPALGLGTTTRSADGEVNIDQALPCWQARLARNQLDDLDDTAQKRKETTRRYVSQLTHLIPVAARQSGASLIRLPLLTDSPSQLQVALKTAGIHVDDTWYDTPVSPARYYEQADFPEADCPVAVKTAKRLINLPTHRRVKKSHIDKIVSIINSQEKSPEEKSA